MHNETNSKAVNADRDVKLELQKLRQQTFYLSFKCCKEK